jgi:hypothetical protein
MLSESVASRQVSWPQPLYSRENSVQCLGGAGSWHEGAGSESSRYSSEFSCDSTAVYSTGLTVLLYTAQFWQYFCIQFSSDSTVGVLWDWGTVGLGTVGLGHCGNWDNVGLGHCGTEALLDWATVGLGHCGTGGRCDGHFGTGTVSLGNHYSIWVKLDLNE